MFAIFFVEGMNPFYENISSFPTAVFTFFLAVTVLYWMVAVLGLVDLDILDFDIPDLDGDLDVNVASSSTTPDVLAGLMLRFGLQGVPVTIIVSLISLFGWLVCYYLVHFTFAYVPNGFMQFLAGIPVLFLSLYISVIVTSIAIKPLRPLFKKATAESVKYILGQSAVVRSTTVDNEFGEAILKDGGAGLILKVRTGGDDTFVKGDRVVLLEYLKSSNAYRVISEREFKN